MAFLSGSGGYTAPNLQNPATTAQAGTQYTNAQNALQQQQALVQALQAQNGIGNQSNVYNQLQGVVAGTGPNPAQAMLNNATGANVAQQAALLGSARGASANPGLIARQAAQAGAGAQQQAVGQAAALQAQQSLNALGQAGNIANTQVAQQQQAIGANNQFSQNEQQTILNQINAQNQAALGQAAQQNAFTANQNNLLGGAIGGALNSLGGASGILSGVGKIFGGPSSSGTSQFQGYMPERGFADGGQVPNLKENYGKNRNPKLEAARTNGKGSNPLSRVGQHLASGGMSMKRGGPVPGKAQKAGDHPANDTVPAMLSPGEIVVPRSVVNRKDAPHAAAKFVDAVKKKHAK